jgi:methyl-accepting chemotaxis protein
LKLGFKGKIIFGAVAMITLTLISIQSLSLSAYRSDKITQVENLSNRIIELEAYKVESWVKKPLSVIQNSIADLNAISDSAQLKSALALIVSSNGLSNLFVGLNSGEIYSEGIDIQGLSTQTAWFELAKKTAQVSISDVMFDTANGDAYLYLVAPLNNGVLASRIELKQLTELLKQVNFPGAIIAIYDSQMRTIASTGEADKPGQKLSSHPQLVSLEQAMFSQGNGSHELTLMDVDKVSYFRVVPLLNGVQWHMLIALDKAVAYEKVEQATLCAALTTLFSIIIAIPVLILLLNYLYRPILELKEMILSLSSGNGDLTHQLVVRSNDDLGMIAAGINKFISNLREMMLEVEAASVVMSDGLNLVKHSVSENSRVLNQHAVETEQVVTAVAEMSATAESVAQNAATAATYTRKTNQEALASKVVVNDAVTSMGSLIHEVDAMAASIQTMNNDTQNINAILKVIGDISEQTNLLALNAAIEAARAGEQGRGFAVVADEVRALAARTRRSTDEINVMLANLSQASAQVMSEMQGTKISCETAAENTAGVSEHLDVMSGNIVEITDIGDQIATAAEEQSAVAEDINRNMTMIRDMVNALVVNSDTSLSNANTLAQSNAKLIALVGQFKLN